MRSVPAREIKRRGISAVDEQLKKGPVYVFKNDEPRYVVLSYEQYQDLLEENQPFEERIRESMADYEAGRFEYKTAEELIEEFDLEGQTGKESGSEGAR